MFHDDKYWTSQRKRIFLPRDSINLNAGTLSPTPVPVMEALGNMRRQQAAVPSDFLWRFMPPLLIRARNRLATYFKCSASNLLLLPNVTHAINLAADSLKLEAGSEILTTDHEYGAMMFCWQRLSAERGWTVRTVTLPYKTEDPAELVAALESAISPKTKVLFFSHVASTTGLVLPAEDLCAMARKHSLISVIDGAHAAGMVPLDLAKIDADFYAGNCHKWLMAPMGAGFLQMRTEHKTALRPPVASWGWGYPTADIDADSGCGGTKWHHALEFHGCTERCPQMVLPDVFEFRESLGGDAAILQRSRDLSHFAREYFASLGFEAATPVNPQLSGALTAFEFPSVDPIPYREKLWAEHRIECPVSVAAGRCFLRVSTAWFVTRNEIEKLGKAIVALKT
ncbi:MAG: aminotransferase class V-fold PLP-dependent enzyme [Planctomycetota bacterium]